MYYFLLLSLLQGLIFSSWLLTRRMMEYRKKDIVFAKLSSKEGCKQLCLWPCRESLYFFTRKSPELDNWGCIMNAMNQLAERQKRDKQFLCTLKDVLGVLGEEAKDKQDKTKGSASGKEAEAIIVNLFKDAKKANIALTASHKEAVLAMGDEALQQEKLYWTMSASRHWGVNFGYRFNSEEDAKDDTKPDDRKYIMLQKLNNQIRQLYYYQRSTAQELRRKIFKTIALQADCAASVDNMEELMEKIDRKNEMAQAFGGGIDEGEDLNAKAGPL